MEINGLQAELLMAEGKQPWFHILVYSSSSKKVGVNIPPQKVGEFSCDRAYVHPMGKRGKPLNKSWSTRHFNKLVVKYFDNENDCLKDYRDTLSKYLEDIEESRAYQARLHEERKRDIEALMI
ncbi:hypothetical protein [Vibrio owensii]|uniref:hypothetical protein n=1 Tax=Vibrio owensii TaxID=696485 RepID=UPI003CC634EF